MSVVSVKKEKNNVTNVTLVRKMRDYSKEPAFKKKAEDALAFIKKHRLPNPFQKKK